MDLVPSVPITLDRPRSLRFDVNAAIAFQQAAGQSVFDLLGSMLAVLPEIAALEKSDSGEPRDAAAVLRLMGKLPLAGIRTMLWAGLLHEDPGLKPEAVGAMLAVNFGTLLTVASSLASAMTAQGPEPPAEGAATPPQSPQPA